MPHLDSPLPRIGFGCEQLGGHAWGNVSGDEVLRAVEVALDQGVTLFDTADVYGLGVSEERLGRALEGKRNRAQVITKGGVRISEGRSRYDCSPAWLRTALRDSLDRLRTDYVDIYVVHYWDGRTPWCDVFETLDRFVTEGKILAYGLSNVATLTPSPRLPTACRLVQGEFSLANRTVEAGMRRLIEGSSAVPVFYGCLGQGILSGKYTRESSLADSDRRNHPRYGNFHGERLEANLRIVDKLKEIAAAMGRPVPQVAMRWILDYWPEATILAGIKTVTQLDDLIACLEWKLEDRWLRELERLSVPTAVNIPPGSAFPHRETASSIRVPHPHSSDIRHKR